MRPTLLNGGGLERDWQRGWRDKLVHRSPRWGSLMLAPSTAYLLVVALACTLGGDIDPPVSSGDSASPLAVSKRSRCARAPRQLPSCSHAFVPLPMRALSHFAGKMYWPLLVVTLNPLPQAKKWKASPSYIRFLLEQSVIIEYNELEDELRERCNNVCRHVCRHAGRHSCRNP